MNENSSSGGTTTGATTGDGTSGGSTTGATTGSSTSGGTATGDGTSGGTTTGATSSGGSTTGTMTGTDVIPSGTVLLNADFESRGAGVYVQDQVEDDFGASPPWSNGLGDGRAQILEEDGNSFLRIDYPTGAVGPGDGGAQFNVPLGGSHDELYASYRIRFGAGFNFVKGGKLPGLCGGSCKTGGGGAPDDGFSARGMWRTDGAAVQYMYYLEQEGEYGEDFDWELDGVKQFSPGTWHTVVHRVVMNTPGTADGIVEAWLDGEKVLERTDVRFRTDDSFGIDSFYFSTFFGGNTSDWAPTQDETVDFDSFIVSTGPIR